MSLENIVLPKFDPYSAISTPTRPVEGIAKARLVVADVDFDEYGRWIYVGTSGAVSYVGWDGVLVAIPVLTAGVFHPIFAKRINSSGTTATGLIWGN